MNIQLPPFTDFFKTLTQEQFGEWSVMAQESANTAFVPFSEWLVDSNKEHARTMILFFHVLQAYHDWLSLLLMQDE